MPIDLKRYPKNWRRFSAEIRFIRARGRCECKGQCGLHGGIKAQRQCTETHGKPANFAKGTVVLTTAHLCHCDPPCAKPHHVIAACQRCHLRIDRELHLKHMRERGTLKTPPWFHPAKK